MILEKISYEADVETREYYNDHVNSSLVIRRYGKMRLINIWNMKPSDINNISFDAIDRVKGTVDGMLGWVWDGGSVSRGVSYRLAGYGFSLLQVGDSTGNYANTLTDGNGTVFGSIFYIADI